MTGAGRMAESLALGAETAKTPGEGSVWWTSPLSEPKEMPVPGGPLYLGQPTPLGEVRQDRL